MERSSTVTLRILDAPCSDAQDLNRFLGSNGMMQVQIQSLFGMISAVAEYLSVHNLHGISTPHKQTISNLRQLPSWDLITDIRAESGEFVRTKEGYVIRDALLCANDMTEIHLHEKQTILYRGIMLGSNAYRKVENMSTLFPHIRLFYVRECAALDTLGRIEGNIV